MSAVVIATIASMAVMVGVFVWTSREMRRDLANYMRENAAYLRKSEGRCGAASPSILNTVPAYCELTAGHSGDHRNNVVGGSGVTTEWGLRR